MKSILKIVSLLGLLFTLVPSFFVFSGTIAIESHYTLMSVGMVLWFGSAPFWMRGASLEDDSREPGTSE